MPDNILKYARHEINLIHLEIFSFIYLFICFFHGSFLFFCFFSSEKNPAVPLVDAVQDQRYVLITFEVASWTLSRAHQVCLPVVY